MRSFVVILILGAAFVLPSFAGENLKLNPKLDYTSDSQDGPLITGDHMDEGPAAGKPAYVIIYGEGCYNSKRQARRTVSLYEKYSGRVQFVVIDLDHSLSPAQKVLEKKYFSGYIPHVVVLDWSGEVDEAVISELFDKSLR